MGWPGIHRCQGIICWKRPNDHTYQLVLMIRSCVLQSRSQGAGPVMENCLDCLGVDPTLGCGSECLTNTQTVPEVTPVLIMCKAVQHVTDATGLASYSLLVSLSIDGSVMYSTCQMVKYIIAFLSLGDT